MAKFPTAQEIGWAAADPEYYHELRTKITGEDNKRRFDAAVDAAYRPRPLTVGEQRVLKFYAERPRYTRPGAFEEAIRAEFAISAARYYRVLNALLDRPEALDYAPLVVKRLRRMRDARRAARSTAGLGRAA